MLIAWESKVGIYAVNLVDCFKRNQASFILPV